MTDLELTDALQHVASALEGDSNGELANVVDGLFAIARAIDHLTDVYEANL